MGCQMWLHKTWVYYRKEILDDIDVGWGDTITVKYEAHSEALDDAETAEYTFTYDGDEDEGNTFFEDSRCLWKKPEETTWIKLGPTTVDDVFGTKLTWVQYDADTVDISIDDGTNTFPWKLRKTNNE